MSDECNRSSADLKEPPRPTSLEDDLASRRITHIDVTEGIRSLLIDGDSTPSTRTPSSSGQASPRRPRSRAEGPRLEERPKLSRKAATAPPGLLQIRAVPHPPRRAISARPPRQGQNWGGHRRRSALLSPLLPRLSYFGTASSRSTISRRKDSRKSVRIRRNSKNGVWGTSAPRRLERYGRLTAALQKHEHGAWGGIVDARWKQPFSERPRVKQTLKNKHIKILDPNFVDFNRRGLPDTPSSVVDTPREMYATPPEGKTSHVAMTAKCGEGLARPGRTVHKELHLKHPVSPDEARQLSLPLTPDLRRQKAVRRTSSEHTVWSQGSRLWKVHVYVPGPIRLEPRLSVSRKGSIATLEPFVGELHRQQRRPSDDAALEGVIMYFESLGVLDEATEDGMDKFWEEPEEPIIQVKIQTPTSPHRSASKMPGTDEPAVTRGPSILPSPPATSPSNTPVALPSVPEDEKQKPSSLSPKIFRNSEDKPSSPSLHPRFKLRRFFRSASSLPKG